MYFANLLSYINRTGGQLCNSVAIFFYWKLVSDYLLAEIANKAILQLTKPSNSNGV